MGPDGALGFRFILRQVVAMYPNLLAVHNDSAALFCLVKGRKPLHIQGAVPLASRSVDPQVA